MIFKRPTAYIQTVVFSGGQTVRFAPNEQVLVVGANNSGKSKFLREILEVCQEGTESLARTVVVREMKLRKIGSERFLKSYLDHAAVLGSDNFYRIGDWAFPLTSLWSWSRPYLINGLAQLFIKNISAKDRLDICEQKPSIPLGQPPSLPQHILHRDPSLMDHVSATFKAAFKGSDLMFQPFGGSLLPIHVGEIPAYVDRFTNQYGNDLQKVPLLDEQGDGMKGYAGILFETMTSSRDMTLIDEPEAFLHPPQMRKLGATLQRNSKGQIFVATHSSDIVRGFLEGSGGKVRILRIRREGNVNVVFEAPAAAVNELWRKPVLRYSNALESIFHEQAILCEDDSDCRLFNAMADHLERVRAISIPDTAYIPTGGKAAIRKIAPVLRKVGVPIKAILDIDLLSERSVFQETVEAFGGDWQSFEPLWLTVDKAVREGIAALGPDEIRAEIVRILEETRGGGIPRSRVEDAMRQKNPWSRLKKKGELAIPTRDAIAAFDELWHQLRGIGIYVVRVGETENFCTKVGGHGPSYVTALLDKLDLGDPELASLRDFVERAHIGDHAPL